ncbi:hypothetical protein F4806DRAFT_496261 [Annulohypoxylon nitens]|nr:hypothetical protein F4806DRAFT_496261 [Annulohypoxylon nitens]
MSTSIGDTGPLLILSIATTITYFVTRIMFGHDFCEPLLAPALISLINYIIGLSSNSFNYYVKFRMKQ